MLVSKFRAFGYLEFWHLISGFNGCSALKTLGVSGVFDPEAAELGAMVANVNAMPKPAFMESFYHTVSQIKCFTGMSCIPRQRLE